MIHNFTHMLPINPALNCTKIAISVSFKSVRPEREKSEAVGFSFHLIVKPNGLNQSEARENRENMIRTNLRVNICRNLFIVCLELTSP